MILEESGPGRGGTRPRPESRIALPILADSGSENKGQRLAECLAWCDLHGCRLVHALPGNCPMRDPLPLARIAEAQAAAWRCATPEAPWPNGEQLALASICEQCIRLLLAHPHVRRLRQAAQLAEAPAAKRPQRPVAATYDGEPAQAPPIMVRTHGARKAVSRG